MTRWLLERLVANLVDNAVRSTTPGRRPVRTTATVDGQATLVAANTGPVITRAALGVLFEPFQRRQGRNAAVGLRLCFPSIRLVWADAGYSGRLVPWAATTPAANCPPAGCLRWFFNWH